MTVRWPARAMRESLRHELALFVGIGWPGSFAGGSAAREYIQQCLMRLSFVAIASTVQLSRRIDVSACHSFQLTQAQRGGLLTAVLLAVSVTVSACRDQSLLPYSEDSTPLVLMPASQAAVEDKRGRFREIFCNILEERGRTLPDYRSCDDALTRIAGEPKGTGRPVHLGQSRRQLVAAIVPGLGADCFSDWLSPRHTVRDHIRRSGYDQILLEVDGLSSTANNARQIRDAIIEMKSGDTTRNLVLIGYSKGAPDILEALVSYPEIRQWVAAVVSAGGAVGGSPLANDATQSLAELMKHWPKARCTAGDGGAMESLRPATRKAWLATHPLPLDIAYYSLVTYPSPERISSVLKPSYDRLSQIDARNDGQILFYDQVIPGSTLLGYVNADHWALGVPIARSHSMLGSTIVDENDYPREVLVEALLRFVEEELAEPHDDTV